MKIADVDFRFETNNRKTKNCFLYGYIYTNISS